MTEPPLAIDPGIARVVGSIAVLAVGLFPLSLLGVAFVIAQAVAIGALAVLQEIGLGKAGKRAAA